MTYPSSSADPPCFFFRFLNGLPVPLSFSSRNFIISLNAKSRLLVTNSDRYFLFSAYIPYTAATLGMILCGKYPLEYYGGGDPSEYNFMDQSAFVGFIAVAVVLAILYVLPFIFSKKLRPGWLLFTLVIFILDTLFMLICRCPVRHARRLPVPCMGHCEPLHRRKRRLQAQEVAVRRGRVAAVGAARQLHEHIRRLSLKLKSTSRKTTCRFFTAYLNERGTPVSCSTATSARRSRGQTGLPA